MLEIQPSRRESRVSGAAAAAVTTVFRSMKKPASFLALSRGILFDDLALVRAGSSAAVPSRTRRR